MIANIITLNRPDRTELIKKEIREQGITPNFWEGIKYVNPIIGCNVSHKRIVSFAKNMGVGKTLIMEDDARFVHLGAFKYFLDSEPQDYDVYFAGIYYGHINKDNTVNDFSGMQCYIIHERFYDTFLKLPANKHIDRAMKNIGKFVVCNPFAAIQHETESDVSNTKLKNDRWLNKYRMFDGYDETGKPKSISYEQYKNISVQRAETVQPTP